MPGGSGALTLCVLGGFCPQAPLGAVDQGWRGAALIPALMNEYRLPELNVQNGAIGDWKGGRGG